MRSRLQDISRLVSASFRPYVWAMAILAVLLSVALACGSEESNTTPASTLGSAAAAESTFPITVVDSNGQEVVFEAPPQRIISFSPAMTETLFALGVGDRIVATDDFSDYPPEAEGVPKVGGAFNINLERVAELEPDLVFLSFGRFAPDVEELGIRVLFQEPSETLSGVLEEIQSMGRIVGRAGEAEELTRAMEARIQAVRDKVATVEQGPLVFYELDPLLYTAGPASFIGSLFIILNAQNVADEAGGDFPQLSAEVIIQRDPEVIMLADSAQFTPQKETPETVAARPGWDSIRAVKQGRIYAVSPSLVSRPGPRIVLGLEELAALLYPDLFR